MTPEVDMLNLDKKQIVILFLLIFGCVQKIDKETSFKKNSLSVISRSDQNKFISEISDTLKIWELNSIGKLKSVKGEFSIRLDSLLCFNFTGTRFITCIHTYIEREGPKSDGLVCFYGEKINNKWYYFSGNSFVISRATFNDQDINKPLSYQQLHQAALKNIYSGYLKNGQINEDWFTEHFEGIGWGDFQHQETSDEYLGLKGKRFTNRREFFEAIHLQSVKNNWVARDTTQPLVPLPVKNLP